MPPPRLCPSFGARLQSLVAAPSRPCLTQLLAPTFTSTLAPALATRPFSTSSPKLDWLSPKRGHKKKDRKGRPRVPTGGSVRGTTVVYGDYGLRMKDHDRRISATQLKLGVDTIKQRLRGMKFRMFYRVTANIGVYISGNESRMGKGKGSFDHWATRVAVSKVLFEVQGDLHEQVVRDAFRLAGNKMPGQYEFVKKGDPPVMGITKLGNGITAEDLKRPRVKLPLEQKAARIDSTTP
ncbi:ribosomal protein L16 [Saccharata proteae CBS 121410]|uniref:Ribosomal protein L16 n=1 Tax=Saccharata proteae CBS 121410 TaxID=1314787 RepID=A0A9P4HXU3_9PEZI|nr:ribosomal protein L16 [Saccharata proteae CBS 121410]